MKKLWISVAMAFLVLAGCSKSSEPATLSLIGTWKQTAGSVTGCTDTALNQAESGCTTCITLVLTTSNNVNSYTASGSGSPSSGTWLSGGPFTSLTGYISFTEAGSSSPSTVSYVMTSTTLTLTTDISFPGPGCKIIQKFTRQ